MREDVGRIRMETIVQTQLNCRVVWSGEAIRHDEGRSANGAKMEALHHVPTRRVALRSFATRCDALRCGAASLLIRRQLRANR